MMLVGVGTRPVKVLQSVECVGQVRGGVIDTLPCMVEPYQLEST